MKILLNSKGYKETIKYSGIRGKRYLKNSDEEYIQIQQEARISKLLQKIGGNITFETYEKARKTFYNYPKYETALERIQKSGFVDFEEFYSCKNHKITRIEVVNKTQDVYCLQVPQYHNFALACGVFVHNCGMVAAQTNIEAEQKNKINFPKLMAAIRKKVPVGFSHHVSKQEWKYMPTGDDKLPKKGQILQELESATKQIGSLGGGNHFIELQEGDDGYIWIMIHSGSRNLGYKTAEHHNTIAKEMNKRFWSEVPPSWGLPFLPLDSQEGRDYLVELDYATRFAQANRDLMLLFVRECLTDIYRPHGLLNFFNKPHNFAEMENHFHKNVLVHRKGACRARKGEYVMIPGSQGSHSYIVKGLGNEQSFQSCSHGAGRVMSRKEAQRSLSLEEEQKKLEEMGVYHTLEKNKQLDEAPSAYKDIMQVMENQKDLVEVEVILKPLLVVKA